MCILLLVISVGKDAIVVIYGLHFLVAEYVFAILERFKTFGVVAACFFV